MGLILGVTKKSTFYIGDVPVRVVATEGYQRITVEVAGKQFEITDQESVEIYPRVFVSSGLPQAGKDGLLPRLVIEAPREIVILRSELYERKQKQPRLPNPAPASK